ncbi:hypothetical protein G6F65_020649 [Rhizopus arrhizus]|nr:hypothetical protein G6F65_020649 [Rhizopus arrhizus]
MKLVASLSVGAKERVVVVEVNGQQLLLGVTAGGINTLHTLPEPLPPPAPPAAADPAADDGDHPDPVDAAGTDLVHPHHHRAGPAAPGTGHRADAIQPGAAGAGPVPHRDGDDADLGQGLECRHGALPQR